MKLQQQSEILKPLYVHAVGFSTGWIRGCVRIRAFTRVYMVEMNKDGVLLTMAVFPLAIKDILKRYSSMLSEKSILVFTVMLFRSKVYLRCYVRTHASLVGSIGA